MADIKDSVGDGATNRRHEVALIQALLRAAKNAKGHSYFNGYYDGVASPNLKSAITAFQIEQKLVAEKKNAFATGFWAPPKLNLNPFKAPVAEKSGFIGPKSATMTKLLATVPAQYKSLRVLEDSSLVYWESAPGSAEPSAKAVEQDPGLEPIFRATIAKVIREMYATHKITLSVPPPNGGLRTFQQQYELATKKGPKGQPPPTGAGPGESNHNFGFAVDLAFDRFKWLTPAGLPVLEDPWLQSIMKSSYAKFTSLWAIRNKIAVNGLGLHKTHRKDDIVHLQNFDDTRVSMSRSLAILMTVVGKHKWQFGGGVFKCDFGLGAKFYPVGKSEEIWSGKAQVTAPVLAEALKAAKKAANVKEADVQALRLNLKADMEAAETNRFRWVPVP